MGTQLILEVNNMQKSFITILGLELPVSEKILYPKKTEVIKSYIQAIKDGKGEANKILKKPSSKINNNL